MRSVTLTNANENYNLATLLAAVAPTLPGVVSGKIRCQMIQIQVDVDAGAARVFVGDPDSLSASDCGAELVATQALTIQSVDSNLIMLSDISVRTDTAGARINVTMVVR